LYHVFMRTDAIVVLGSGISSDGELLPKAIKRVNMAVELFKSGIAERIIMSGRFSWHRDDLPSKTEAEAMKELAVSLDVPAEKILLENRSKDTLGNLFFTKIQFLEARNWHNIIVVTSNYHKERVQFLCKKILGSNYTFRVVGVDTDMPPDELRERLEREGNKLAFVSEHLEKIPDGHDEKFKDIILNKHPAYKDDPTIRDWLA